MRTVGAVGRVAVMIAVVAFAAGACRIETRVPEQNVGRGDSARTADSIAVVAMIEAYYEDFSARAWDGFASHFWPGADITTVFPPPGDSMPRVVVMPVEEFVVQAPSGPGSREIFEERPERIDVTVQGDLGTVWVRYSARFGDPGAIHEWTGTDVFTVLRHGGQWKIVELAFAADAAGVED